MVETEFFNIELETDLLKGNIGDSIITVAEGFLYKLNCLTLKNHQTDPDYLTKNELKQLNKIIRGFQFKVLNELKQLYA